jgi:sec-independent protein translocase protein TatC
MAVSQYDSYIKEIRVEFAKVLALFLVGFILGAFYYQVILTNLIGLFQLEGINLVLTSPYQFIGLSLKTGAITGLVLCLPLFVFYLLKFIRPALAPKEYKLLIQLLPLSVVLFVIGFSFGIWIIQFVIDLFSRTSASFSIENIWDLSGFLSQILLAGISLAFVFQLPVVLTVLLRLGVVSSKVVGEQRKIIYSVAMVLAALLSPADILSFFIFTLVSLFLFEVTLLLNRR